MKKHLTDSCNLTNKILIASPFAMKGNLFHKSLIYVADHNEEGAFGLIFNHLLDAQNIDSKLMQSDDVYQSAGMLVSRFMRKLDRDISIHDIDLNVHVGGPINLERGFFLHTSEYKTTPLFHSLNADLAISSNPTIFNDIRNNIGPKHSIFVVGYTGWAAKQLEFEVENGLWLVSNPDLNIMFSQNTCDQWSTTLATLGISASEFIPLSTTC